MKRLLLVGVTLFAAAAVTAVVVRSGVATSSAKAASPGNGLSAYVVLSNRGPLPPCPTDGCTAANLTYPYVHVINANPVANSVTAVNRTATPNAYVLDSVDATILVNGTVFSQETLTPPPNVTPRPGPSGRWPATVTCRSPPGPPPCTTVLNPAILPDENTIAFYYAWFHAPDEPTGSYVFQFTLHGTLNGSPVDLTASSKAIQMT
jgi:hypothetical protein